MTDAYGNPLGGQTIIFKPSSGSVVPARGLTDADGRTDGALDSGTQVPRQPELAGTVAGSGVSRTLVLSARP